MTILGLTKMHFKAVSALVVVTTGRARRGAREKFILDCWGHQNKQHHSLLRYSLQVSRKWIVLPVASPQFRVNDLNYYSPLSFHFMIFWLAYNSPKQTTNIDSA